jgi:hypothetical protein
LLAPSAQCRLMREETGGPVIPITVVDSIERALLLACDSDYALSASGWTSSDETAERLMLGLNAGVVTINDVLYSFGEPSATWSGDKLSGFGQNHGTPGLREMSRQRFVSADDQPTAGPLFSFPYDAEAKQAARTSLDYLHGKGFLARWRGMLRMARLPRMRSRLRLRWLLFPKKHAKR